MDGYIVIETSIDTKEFESQMTYIESRMLEIEDLLEKADYGFEVGDTLKLEAEYEKLANRLIDLKKRKEDFNKVELESSKLKQAIESIGSEIPKVTRKITGWGLALIGVRGAFGFIKSAISDISQQSQEFSNQIQYLKFSIASALQPVLEFILNIVYKIIAGIGAIIKLIFGVNIFARATADSFKKVNKNVKSASKSSKELQKTLAGFDEINKVDGSVGSGVGGLGGLGADIQNNLEGIRDLSLEVDKLGQKIKKWFLGGDYANIGDALIGNLKDFPNNMKKIFEPLYRTIIKPYVVDNFKYAINQWKNDLRPIWEPLKPGFENAINGMKGIWQQFVDVVEPNVIQPISNSFDKFKKGFLSKYSPFLNKIIDGINGTFGIFGVHLDHIQDEAEETGNLLNGAIGGALDGISKKANATSNSTSNWFTNAVQKISNAAKNLSNTNYNLNISPKSVNNAEKSVDTLTNSLKEATKKTWGIVTTLTMKSDTKSVNSFWSNLGNKLSKVGIKLPKLATGGIVNNPGKGVMMGSYIAGERGAEAVIPLDDQTMNRLGESIARHMSVNLTNINQMNSRVIGREMKKVFNDSDFAYNR